MLDRRFADGWRGGYFSLFWLLRLRIALWEKFVTCLGLRDWVSAARGLNHQIAG